MSGKTGQVKAKKPRRAAAKRPVGRPTVRSPKVEAAICARLSQGEFLAEICRDKGMPGVSTVYDWVEADKNFAGRIARARDDGWDKLAREAMQIVDEEPERVIVITGEDRSSERIDSASVQRQKNRAEIRLKLLSKWDPKRYGEKLDVNANVKSESTVTHKLPDEVKAALADKLLEAVEKRVNPEGKS